MLNAVIVFPCMTAGRSRIRGTLYTTLIVDSIKRTFNRYFDESGSSSVRTESDQVRTGRNGTERDGLGRDLRCFTIYKGKCWSANIFVDRGLV